MNEIKYLDVKLLTGYIHLSKSTIYKMVSNKSIPHKKIGSRTLFNKNEIDQWVENYGEMRDENSSLPQI